MTNIPTCFSNARPIYIGYFGKKLLEISELFEGELKLNSKSEQQLKKVPDYITIGRHTRENKPCNSCGLELVYQTEQNKDKLVVYVALLYKLNSKGRKYPFDFFVAADFEEGKFANLLDTLNDSSFLFADSFEDMDKKSRFDQISELKKGSTLRELIIELGREFARK